MVHHKLHLPEKRCPQCGLTFSWRKKWQLNWDKVIYCSERCRRSKTADKTED
ncbi:MAG: DUF2256 domain-containing protein [Gammaproteobacteria bacterium]|nr:DUF2256 domain-containing protein [Gammaproteobacteria bacterium]MBU1555771.1 DUF2256 domain-containing protein [Gammaproteobacteria bacterium]MBU2070077.1 DUF2256 domain-containing protein [Gammaproteobacteria bacterium]MBU2183627.1 DUF2256 domain-containing protein [Gammaproteobacteria bacterium]MBU2205611.1 DUF2256 domain-containing protein [Gammaproteobacteria bacterium]